MTTSRSTSRLVLPGGGSGPAPGQSDVASQLVDLFRGWLTTVPAQSMAGEAGRPGAQAPEREPDLSTAAAGLRPAAGDVAPGVRADDTAEQKALDNRGKEFPDEAVHDRVDQIPGAEVAAEGDAPTPADNAGTEQFGAQVLQLISDIAADNRRTAELSSEIVQNLRDIRGDTAGAEISALGRVVDLLEIIAARLDQPDISSSAPVAEPESTPLVTSKPSGSRTPEKPPRPAGGSTARRAAAASRKTNDNRGQAGSSS